MNLTMPIVVGVVFGLGVYALVRALMPTRRSAIQQVARIDAMRARGSAYETQARAQETGRLGTLRAQVGTRVAEFYLQQGWEQRSLRADLAVLDRSWEKFLATKALLGVRACSSARSCSRWCGRWASARARSSRCGWR